MMRLDARKRFLTGLVALTFMITLSLTIAACGDEEDSASGSSGDQLRIGVVLKTFTVEYWQLYRSAAEQVAADNPDIDFEIVASATETDVRGQIALVEDLLVKDVDGIMITAMSDALAPVLQRAADQGVKVALAEAPVEGFDDYVTLVGPAQYDSAAGGADYLIDNVGNDLKVAILTAPGYPVVEERLDGVVDTFKDAGAEVLTVAPARDCDRTNALNSMQDILQGFREVNTVYTTCAPPDLGAITAIKQAGMVPGKDIHVFGFDGLSEEFEAIRAGTLTGTVDQRPDLQSKAAIEATIAAVRGERVPEETVSETSIVDESNVDEALARIRKATAQ